MEKNPSQNWHGIKSFEVGRVTGFKNPPVKRVILLLLFVTYLAIGLILYLFLKFINSSRGSRNTKFKTVVFMWPKMFLVLINHLKIADHFIFNGRKFYVL